MEQTEIADDESEGANCESSEQEKSTVKDSDDEILEETELAILPDLLENDWLEGESKQKWSSEDGGLSQDHPRRELSFVKYRIAAVSVIILFHPL